LRDIATLSRGLSESPSSIYHANGRQAVTMGVSFIPGVNVIDVGRALESKLDQMSAEKPAGIKIDLFYDQAAEVAHSVNGFITNFLMALAIVVGVLLIFMGVRSGIIIALSLAQRARHAADYVSVGHRATAYLAGGADYRPEYAGR
jgi:multidrug efflux pump subunit AcrB